MCQQFLVEFFGSAQPRVLDLDIAVRLPLYIAAMGERLRSRPVRLVFEWLGEVLGPSVPWLSDLENPRIVPASNMTDTLELLLPGSGGG